MKTIHKYFTQKAKFITKSDRFVNNKGKVKEGLQDSLVSHRNQ